MIVSCGEALVDLVAGSTSDIRSGSGDAGSGSVVRAVTGGGPLNVAVAVARLGVLSAFVGRVSTDEYGEQIWRYLTENGVDLRACERGPEPTARAIVEHTPKLKFRFEGDHTADTQLGVADLSLLAASPTTSHGTHSLHGGTLGMFRGRTAETLANLVEEHAGHGGVVSLDPNVRPQIISDRQRWDHFHQRWLAATHIYKASDEDLDWIWPSRDHSASAAELLAGNAEVVFVTHGAAGATCYTSGSEFHVRGIDLSGELVDTVGAGDAFIGSILASLASLNAQGIANTHTSGSKADSKPDTANILKDITTAEWRQITERAVLAAAITCTRIGADPPTAAELAEAAESTGPASTTAGSAGPASEL